MNSSAASATSEVNAETTDVLTTTEFLSSAASTGSLTSISSHFAVTLGSPASDTVGVSHQLALFAC